MPRIFCLAALIAGASCAQTPTALPAFDSVSIKPGKSDRQGYSWNSSTGYIVMKNPSLRMLVSIAYGVREDRVLGGPKWSDADRFDIEARAEGPAKDPELLLMLRRLLTDRFHLAMHRENRTIEGYSLVPIKETLKIRPDETPGPSKSSGSPNKFEAHSITMGKFADFLSRRLGTPVTDSTNAKGVYTFTLEWPPDAPMPETLFDTVAQHLGLKLLNRKMPAEVIVLDSAEKPGEN